MPCSSSDSAAHNCRNLYDVSKMLLIRPIFIFTALSLIIAIIGNGHGTEGRRQQLVRVDQGTVYGRRHSEPLIELYNSPASLEGWSEASISRMWPFRYVTEKGSWSRRGDGVGGSTSGGYDDVINMEISEVVHDADVLGMKQHSDMRRRSRRRMQEQVGSYCVAMGSADTGALQAALDWACGSGSGYGNVDCSVLQEGGSCYTPNDLADHASYAFNAYYVAQNGASGSCSFGGVATITTTNPSSGTCVYAALGTSSTGTPPPPASASGPSTTDSSSIIASNSTTTESSSSSAFSDILTTHIHYTLCALLVGLVAVMEIHAS